MLFNKLEFNIQNDRKVGKTILEIIGTRKRRRTKKMYTCSTLTKVDAYIFLRGKSLSGESLIGAFLVELEIAVHRKFI